MRRHVERRFNRWLMWKFGQKVDVTKFLLNHERKQKCIDNVCDQITEYEIRYPHKANTQSIAKLIDAAAGMFARAALNNAEQRARSVLANQLEADRIRQKADREKEIMENVIDMDDVEHDNAERAIEEKEKAQRKTV